MWGWSFALIRLLDSCFSWTRRRPIQSKFAVWCVFFCFVDRHFDEVRNVCWPAFRWGSQRLYVLDRLCLFILHWLSASAFCCCVTLSGKVLFYWKNSSRKNSVQLDIAKLSSKGNFNLLWYYKIFYPRYFWLSYSCSADQQFFCKKIWKILCCAETVVKYLVRDEMLTIQLNL